MELLQLSTESLKRGSFHFPPVGFAGFFSCPITGSVDVVVLPAFFNVATIAGCCWFVRICGCMTWHKVWLSHVIEHPWKPSKLITAHGEEWALLGDNQGTDVVRVCRQPPPCKNRQSRGPSHCQYACTDVARCIRLLAPVLVVLHGLGRQTQLPDRRVVRARDRCQSENPWSARSDHRPACTASSCIGTQLSRLVPWPPSDGNAVPVTPRRAPPAPFH